MNDDDNNNDGGGGSGIDNAQTGTGSGTTTRTTTTTTPVPKTTRNMKVSAPTSSSSCSSSSSFSSTTFSYPLLFGRQEQIQELEEIFEEVCSCPSYSTYDTTKVETAGPSSSSASVPAPPPPAPAAPAPAAATTAAMGSSTSPGENATTAGSAPESGISVDGSGPTTASQQLPQHVVWIGGEAGTGKSALARDVLRRACRRVGGIYLQGKFNFSSSPSSSPSPSTSNLQTHPHSDWDSIRINNMNIATDNTDSRRHTTMDSPAIQPSPPYSALIEACMGIVDDLQLVYYGESDGVEYRHHDDDQALGATTEASLAGGGEGERRCDTEASEKGGENENFYRWKFPKSTVHKIWNDHREELQVLEPIFPNLRVLFDGDTITRQTTKESGEGGRGNDDDCTVENMIDSKNNKNSTTDMKTEDRINPTTSTVGTVTASSASGTGSSRHKKQRESQTSNVLRDSSDGRPVDDYDDETEDGRVGIIAATTIGTDHKSIDTTMNNKQAVQFAFYRFFEILTILAPVVVLVIDDWQWCSDEATLEVLDVLLGISKKNIAGRRINSNMGRLLTVGTVRTDEETIRTTAHHTLQELVGRTEKHQRMHQRLVDRKHAEEHQQPLATINLVVHELATEELSVSDILQWLLTLLHEEEKTYFDKMSNIHNRHRRCDLEHQLVPLAECIALRTGGNALYVQQFILLLNRRKLLCYDASTRSWSFDVENILQETDASPCVVSFLTQRLLGEDVTGDSAESSDSDDSSLSSLDVRREMDIQKWLIPRIAALGTMFSQNVFDVVFEAAYAGTPSPVVPLQLSKSKFLSRMESDGILTVNKKRRLIRWTHDKIREAALGEDINRRNKIRFEVGRLLLGKLQHKNIMTSELYLLCDLFDGTTRSYFVRVCGQKDGMDVIDQVIKLQLHAGQLSLKGSASMSASIFFSRGLQLLTDSDCWSEQNRETTLALYTGISQASYLIGDHKATIKYYEIVSCRNGVSLLEKKDIINAYINSLGAQNIPSKTTKEILIILAKLDVHFPRYCTKAFVTLGMIKLVSSLDKKIRMLSNLEHVRDDRLEWIMFLLDRLATYSYQSDPLIGYLGILRMLQYTMEGGLTEYTGIAIGTVAIVISALVGDLENGTKLASLAVQYSSPKTKSRILFVVYGFVFHNLKGYSRCQAPLLDAYEIGLRNGDLESAFWAALLYCQYLMYSGQPLERIGQKLKVFISQMKSLDQNKCYMTCISFQQCIFNLLRSTDVEYATGDSYYVDEDTDCPPVMKGPIMTENDVESLRKDVDTNMQYCMAIRWKVFCAFWCGAYGTVYLVMKGDDLDNYKKIEQMHVGIPDYGPLYSYCALSCIALYRRSSCGGGRTVGKHKYLNVAKKLHERIHVWVNEGNKNLQHIESLLEAELGDIAPVRRRNSSICRKNYDLAILQANRWGFAHEEALAHELFGDFLIREQERSRASGKMIGGGRNFDAQEDIDVKEAKAHYGRAVQLYQQWGVQSRAEKIMYGHSEIHASTPTQSRRATRSGWQRLWKRGPLNLRKTGGEASLSSSSHDKDNNSKRLGEMRSPASLARSASSPSDPSSEHRRVPLEMLIKPNLSSSGAVENDNCSISLVSKLSSIPEE